jgi:hypothetical protein
MTTSNYCHGGAVIGGFSVGRFGADATAASRYKIAARNYHRYIIIVITYCLLTASCEIHLRACVSPCSATVALEICGVVPWTRLPEENNRDVSAFIFPGKSTGDPMQITVSNDDLRGAEMQTGRWMDRATNASVLTVWGETDKKYHGRDSQYDRRSVAGVGVLRPTAILERGLCELAAPRCHDDRAIFPFSRTDPHAKRAFRHNGHAELALLSDWMPHHVRHVRGSTRALAARARVEIESEEQNRKSLCISLPPSSPPLENVEKDKNILNKSTKSQTSHSRPLPLRFAPARALLLIS